MPLPLPLPLSDLERPRINRAPSPVLAALLPWILVMLGSFSPTWPLIASSPVLPPLGFLFLVAWQQLRPGVFPLWVGLPLGLVDDMFSGQPFGSAVLLWSVTMIALDLLELRIPWRSFWHDWLVAAGIITAYLLLDLWLANMGGGAISPLALVPQIATSVLVYPLAARVVGLCDRLRLVPFRTV